MEKLLIIFFLAFWLLMAKRWWDDCSNFNKLNRFVESLVMGFCVALPVTMMIGIAVACVYLIFV